MKLTETPLQRRQATVGRERGMMCERWETTHGGVNKKGGARS